LLKLEPFRNQEIFEISLFSFVQILVLNFFWQFKVDILPLGSGSVDPPIFADPDPGTQILADQTDPDPKHQTFYMHKTKIGKYIFCLNIKSISVKYSNIYRN